MATKHDPIATIPVTVPAYPSGSRVEYKRGMYAGYNERSGKHHFGLFNGDNIKLDSLDGVQWDNVPTDWLFVCTRGNCYDYSDKTKETNGDFHLIARVHFRPLEIEILDNSPEYVLAHVKAKADYEQIKANINTPIVVSTSGQTIQPYLK